MSKKKHTTSKGDTFEWEETDEVRQALERLHNDIRKGIDETQLKRPNPPKKPTNISELESQAPDYGVGK